MAARIGVDVDVPHLRFSSVSPGHFELTASPMTLKLAPKFNGGGVKCDGIPYPLAECTQMTGEQLAGKATALFAPSLEAAAHRMTCRDEAWAIACSTQGW